MNNQGVIGTKSAWGGQRNNFTPLRLSLSMLVLLFHFGRLDGVYDPYWPLIYPEFSVDGFFIISGFIIFASYDRLPDLRSFLIKRFCRLYPLYFVVILLQAIIMLSIQPDGIRSHLSEGALYLVANATFLNFLHNEIGGVFRDHTDPGINPSLWTLKIEVAFYLLVPLLWLAVRRWGLRFIIVLFVLSASYSAIFRHFGKLELSRQLPGAMQYFTIGIVAYRYPNLVRRGSAPGVIAALLISAVLVSLIEGGIGPFAAEAWRILFPVFTAIVVFVIAFRSPPLNFNRDISYGTYLIHGPVIQLSMLAGWYQFSATCLAGIIAFVLLLAILAEVAIERPFIALGHVLARSRTGDAAKKRAGLALVVPRSG